MAEETAGFRERVVEYLDQDRRRILLNWASRVGALPAFRQRPDLELSAVLDDVPTIFDDLVGLLREATLPSSAELGPIEAHAGAHAKVRAALGFAGADIAQEYQQLRQTIWSEIRSHVAMLQPTVGDVLDLEHRLNYVSDDIVIATFATFEHLDAST